VKNITEFREQAHKMVDWIADYFVQIRQYPVKPKIEPNQIVSELPAHPPLSGCSMDEIFTDFKNIVLPGITHWQHPNFHGYFPSNNSFPSILAEFLTAAIGTQCMKWETSPAGTELEIVVMNWLREMIGLPESFQGVINDSASTSTLCAILAAREKYSYFEINDKGFNSFNNFKIYCSSEAHSSVEKAVKIAGIGSYNLTKIPVDENFAMNPAYLRKCIENDKKSGKLPICVIAALGTTGSTAVDPLYEIANICADYNLWLHVDAAFAGSALILPEFKDLLKGIKLAQSFVFNPHKWLFTNFDCSAFFVQDKDTLIKTFELIPEYLKTKTDVKINDYSNWGPGLGRRFRALKLWFVIRSFGVSELQAMIRNHIAMAKTLEQKIRVAQGFEILAPVNFNLICFRYKPKSLIEQSKINTWNEKLLSVLNASGKVFLSHTKLNGNYVLRMVLAQTNIEQSDVDMAWDLIQAKVLELEQENLLSA